MIDYGISIQNRLYAATDVKALLALQVYDEPALFNAKVIPQEFESSPAINFYRTSPIEGGSEVDQESWTINCWALTEELSEALAFAVFEELHRNSTAVGGHEYFFIPSVLATLPPSAIEDCFNTPVTLTIKARKT